MIIAVLDPSPLTVCINCSFFTFITIITIIIVQWLQYSLANLLIFHMQTWLLCCSVNSIGWRLQLQPGHPCIQKFARTGTQSHWRIPLDGELWQWWTCAISRITIHEIRHSNHRTTSCLHQLLPQPRETSIISRHRTWEISSSVYSYKTILFLHTVSTKPLPDSIAN